MPVRLSRTGAAAVEPSGKVIKRFASRAKARRYVLARNLAHARSRGYKVPPPLRRRRRKARSRRR